MAHASHRNQSEHAGHTLTGHDVHVQAGGLRAEVDEENEVVSRLVKYADLKA